MKTYLVIGSSSGIGRALSGILLEQGHRVMGTFNRNNDTIQSSNAVYHQLDVTKEDLDLSFIPESLDGLVYCPGSINLMPFHRIKPAEFLNDYSLQVLGAVKVLQGAMPALKKAEGSVVMYSTVAVQNGFTFHSQVATSKGAIEGLTRSLAAEWAPTIRVNCIAPSLTDTPLASKLLSSEEKKSANAQRHPLKKIGQATDIAEMASFLLSDKAAWITGQVMHVDGGMSKIKL
ncbi:MAG: SDR family oxidoreductase [Vicingaceae bacterium]